MGEVNFISIRDAVNRELKKEFVHVASEGDLPSDVSVFLQTGWTLLDAALGGGIPAGRVVELYGEEGSGKSTLCYQLVHSIQAQGGVAVYLDVESTFPKELASSMGVDLDRMILVQEGVFLDGKNNVFDYILKFIGLIKKEAPEAPIVFIWDTLAMTPTLGEITEDDGQTGPLYRAKTIRDGLRKVVLALARAKAALVIVNHVHEVVSDRARWGGKLLTTSGGMAVKYAASARILLRSGALIYDENKRALGAEVTAKVEKSKICIPRGVVKSRLYFGFGYDDRWSVYDYLKDSGVIDQKGAWSHIPGPEGTTVKCYPSKFLECLSENPGLYEHLVGLAKDKYAAQAPVYA